MRRRQAQEEPPSGGTPLARPYMVSLLEAVRSWPDTDLDALRGPEWDQARVWGWAMGSGVLTGTGKVHASGLPCGSLGEHLPDPVVSADPGIPDHARYQISAHV